MAGVFSASRLAGKTVLVVRVLSPSHPSLLFPRSLPNSLSPQTGASGGIGAETVSYHLWIHAIHR